MNQNTVGRREFLRRGSMAAAGAALPLLGSSLEKSPARAAARGPGQPGTATALV